MSSRHCVLSVGAVYMGAAVLLLGCDPRLDVQPQMPGASAQRGGYALQAHECGVCHIIPGVAGAIGRVGPSLASYSRFPYVAGKFPNRPELLVRWIADAPSLAPETAMPAIPMAEQEARDIAAYLYELD